jgi:hypothetical protein
MWLLFSLKLLSPMVYTYHFLEHVKKSVAQRVHFCISYGSHSKHQPVGLCNGNAEFCHLGYNDV